MITLRTTMGSDGMEQQIVELMMPTVVGWSRHMLNRRNDQEEEEKEGFASRFLPKTWKGLEAGKTLTSAGSSKD